MKAKRTLVAAAAGLALSAAPAFATLQRMGPIDHSPTIGGYPAWFQDATGITIEFCDLKSQSELDGGWCVLVPPDPVFPEAFPANFFNEHFYYDADNTLLDTASGFKARLIIALEAAFANGGVVDGDQMTFARTRLFIPNLPFDGDYRVITPFGEVTYTDQRAGDRIFETVDIGVACINTFECTLGAQLGPFLLPSATAGGAELPPMPDLAARPAGTDPFFDAIVAGGGVATPNPGTGKKYLADPARLGPVTGSQLPNFIANEIDGKTPSRNHNTFRVEVRDPAALGGRLVATYDGETNFTVGGRLMTGVLPGLVSGGRGTYKAGATGAVTELDAFASAAPTVQGRIPAQPIVPPTRPILQYYDVPCGGAVTVNAATGATTINPPPYTAPAGAVAHPMAVSGPDYWGQSAPGGLPPTHLCIVDTTARNAAGEVVPAYYLQAVTDDVQITLAGYNGPNNGTLTVNAASSDPTAVLSLANFGPAAAGTPGAAVGRGIGTGLALAGGAASVSALVAPPSRVQVVSTRGGGDIRTVDPSAGSASLVGVPVANADSGTVNEDCSATAATSCAGAPLTVDLLANDTVVLNGVSTPLRAFAASGGAVAVTASTPRLGTATVANGVVTYRPNPNANGLDEILYTVTVNGRVSNQASLAINVVPVNDLPVAGNTAIVAVNARSNAMNLLLNATDPDGTADLRDASIVTWPTQLGARPTPVNGVIAFTPTSTGNFSVTYRASDAAGALSANTATGTVTVVAAENITYTKSDFKGAGNIGGGASTRWTVTGTDTVRQGQKLTIAYLDGVLRAGGTCNGTAVPAACVVGTALVDLATGAWTFDQVFAPGGPLDPSDTAAWATAPRNIRTFSSSPVLGGAQSAAIILR
jgi:hypothetical protein